MLAIGALAARLAVSGWPDAVRAWRIRRRERAFRTVPARITRSEIASEEGDPLPIHFRVEYRFELDGAEHSGAQHQFDAPSRHRAHFVLRRFKVSAQVEARVNPLDPSESFLESSAVRLKASFPLILLLLGICAAFVAGGIAVLTQHGVFRS
jgi:hypothetical protein